MDNFTEMVYGATRKIPEGSVCTYGQIAAHVGAPKAARAVGAALRKNPYGIESGCTLKEMVPCHRVVNRKGELTGFFGKSDEDALSRKQQLLESEGVEIVQGKVANLYALKHKKI